MNGWSLVLTREVNTWLHRLDDATFGQVAYHLDLLRERGTHLSAPRSRPLRCGQPIHQLTIPHGRRTHRLTYCLDNNSTIVALTVRRWCRPARWELRRAQAAIGRYHSHDRGASSARRRQARRGWRVLWALPPRRRPGRGGCGMGPAGKERA